MAPRTFFYLTSHDGRLVERMSAEDLMSYGISKSTAYRAIKRGVLPRHRVRDLQFRVFGHLPGWDGWRIEPGRIISPNGDVFDPVDLENLAYLKRLIDRDPNLIFKRSEY